MAKLSELLTGDPSTWRKVVNIHEPLGTWHVFLGKTHFNKYIGYDESGFSHLYEDSGYDDWEYYEEPKPKCEWEHTFSPGASRCDCDLYDRRELEPKPKVVRWLWVFDRHAIMFDGKTDEKLKPEWKICETFMSEEEAEEFFGKKKKSDPDWASKKLPWTETEFDQ